MNRGGNRPVRPSPTPEDQAYIGRDWPPDPTMQVRKLTPEMTAKGKLQRRSMELPTRFDGYKTPRHARGKAKKWDKE